MAFDILFSDMSLPVESCINIGDKVCVDLNTDTFKGLMQDYGGWNDGMTQTHYSDSEPTRLCSFSLMMRA
jgi:hypothetical protein